MASLRLIGIRACIDGNCKRSREAAKTKKTEERVSTGSLHVENAKGSQGRHIDYKGCDGGVAKMVGSQGLKAAIRSDREVSFHLLAAGS